MDRETKSMLMIVVTIVFAAIAISFIYAQDTFPTRALERGWLEPEREKARDCESARMTQIVRIANLCFESRQASIDFGWCASFARLAVCPDIGHAIEVSP